MTLSGSTFQLLGLLLLTTTAFALSLWLFTRGKHHSWLHPLLHPLVVGSAMIATTLWLLDINYADYKAANWPLLKLLGPTTVALAIPLHREFHYIRALVKPLLTGLLVGSFLSTTVALALAWLVGGTRETLLAISPKSVTTPIALGIAEKISAEPGLVAGIVVFTGVVGGMAATPLFKILNINDDRIQGFALGINAHGVGIARAFEISPRCGAFASLAMSMTGVLIAFLLPLIVVAYQ